jgi:glycine/D-amino acid oxidase-like deaminating enzyme
MPAAQAGSVLVVGAGIIGLAAAWQLAERGHAVTLVDPALAPGHSPADSGSAAALGVLMGRVFQRSSGRAWRLRQQSNALWPQWIAELERRGHRLAYRRGLLLLAADEKELAQQERIAGARAALGLPMRMLGPEELKAYQPTLPGQPLGGLLSADDGQLDPWPVLAALLCEAKRAGAQAIPERAVAVERGRPWRLTLASGQQLQAEWLVLALGLQTSGLLAGLGHALPLEPVLGQALELELPADPGWTWPGAVVWRGHNLVPRPDLGPAGRRLWLGATLEPGAVASGEALDGLRELGGEAPTWLQKAVVVRHWQGLRCRPQGRPAPVLEEPEPGLLVAGGHYRNGLLLAPATAAWVCRRISGDSNEEGIEHSLDSSLRNSSAQPQHDGES